MLVLLVLLLLVRVEGLLSFRWGRDHFHPLFTILAETIEWGLTTHNDDQPLQSR